METSTKRCKGHWYLLPLSFFIPFAVMCLCAQILEIVPFGEHSMGLTDGSLYIYSLPVFGYNLKRGGSFLYSLYNGLGTNAWSDYAWGGLSPLRFLAYFATQENAPELYTWICILNVALCGLTMYLLLSGLRGPYLSHLVFSTSYALIGFNASLGYHYIFFIGVQLLPLMILGLVKLLRGGSPLLYVLSLGACIFINFYFGFFLCEASLVVFIAYYIANRKTCFPRRGRILGTYIAASLCAGMLGAPMWLPALKAYSDGGRLSQAVETAASLSFHENMPFLQIFSKLVSGANSQSEQVDGLPFIFCGILVVALVLLYFINGEIPLRRRLAAGALVIFYLLSFYINAFTRIMHMGSHTNWFNYRYSFVFSFLLIALAWEEFPYIIKLSARDARRCALTLVVSAILVFSTQYDYVSGGMILLDLALLAGMFMLLAAYRRWPLHFNYRAFTLALLIIVCGNLTVNYIVSTKNVRGDDWELDLDAYQTYNIVFGSAVDALNQFDNSFYRMEKDVSETGTSGVDSDKYVYHGIGQSGPTVRKFNHVQLNRLGINWLDMRHWYQKGVPAATDALLGLRYLVATEDLATEKGYESLAATPDRTIYRNPNELSIAIIANAACTEVELGDNAFENLNTVWRAMTGRNKDIFLPQRDMTFTLYNATENRSVTAEELRISTAKTEQGIVEEQPEIAEMVIEFTAEHSGALYRFNTAIPSSNSGSENACIKCVGVFKEGDIVRDTSTANTEYVPAKDFTKACSHFAYAWADAETLAEYAKLLNSRGSTFNVVNDDYLTGSFTAQKGQTVLFTIPWDEGWTAYIDGQPVPINKTWDLFMSIDAPEGQHSYELKFFPAWMNYGMILSGAALVGLIVLMIVWKRKNKSVPAAISEQIQIELSAESSQLD